MIYRRRKKIYTSYVPTRFGVIFIDALNGTVAWNSFTKYALIAFCAIGNILSSDAISTLMEGLLKIILVIFACSLVVLSLFGRVPLSQVPQDVLLVISASIGNSVVNGVIEVQKHKIDQQIISDNNKREVELTKVKNGNGDSHP